MSRRKGARVKRKCKEYFEEEGWIVGDVEKSSRYIKNKDLFNLFDLIAVKGKTIRFIQVKTNKPPTQKEYKEWAQKHCSCHVECVAATWYDYQNWRFQNYKEDGTIEETDLR